MKQVALKLHKKSLYVFIFDNLDCDEKFGPPVIWSWTEYLLSNLGPPLLILVHMIFFVHVHASGQYSIQGAVMMTEFEDVDLFEAAVSYLREREYPEGATVNQKRVIKKKAAKMMLMDGEVFMRKGEQVSDHYVCIL